MSDSPPRGRRPPGAVTPPRDAPIEAQVAAVSPLGVVCRTEVPLRAWSRHALELELPERDAGGRAPRVGVSGIVVDCTAPRDGESGFEVTLCFDRLPRRGGERLCERFAAGELARA